ncbi:phenylpropionate dioxygenase-like ring-hydroxylating dioxygenase large terminal subunit [Bradyrhizobium sp. LM3.2]
MTKPFPMNAWYVAAWDADVKPALLPRTICGKHVVMYRKADGSVAALEDACWHRLVPLSKGRLEGDTVVCGYHGLKYNAQGRCTFMPSQETINPSACVRAYPVVERHRYIWLWMGDPALADPTLVPDMHWNHDPAWAGDGKTIHVNCDYRLVLDNLMDLTHETFVHGSSIGNEAVAEAPFDVTHGEKTVTVTRWMRGIEAPPFWAKQLGNATRQVRSRRPLADHPLRSAVHDRDRRRRGTDRHRRAGRRPLARRQRLRAQHHHARDREDLPLFLGVRAQLSARRAAHHHRDPRRRLRHLPRGRADPRGAAARDGREPRSHLLQPQHRRRRDVDA